MKSSILDTVRDLVLASELVKNLPQVGQNDAFDVEPISPDGSERNFFRLYLHEKPLCVGVAPVEPEGRHLAEAHAAIDIGKHLHSRGVAVPKILAEDRKTGIILFEDCGDIRLYDLINNKDQATPQQLEQADSLYGKAIGQLVLMQTEGVQDFNKQWCFDTSEYNHEVMVKRESEYFLDAFWFNFLGGKSCEGIELEFHDIAEHAGRGMPQLFLHRDFQCRNIMVLDADIKIIDYQGGRLGPPGYDLASLLNDPYSSLPAAKKEMYLQEYLRILHGQLEFDDDIFMIQYRYLALQRNLQIIGAFAFLFKQKGKLFFKSYIRPALDDLHDLLQRSEFKKYSKLREVVSLAKEQLEDTF